MNTIKQWKSRKIILMFSLVAAALFLQIGAAGAQDAASGSVTLSAVVCEETEPADPLNCTPLGEIGAATFYADESGYVLPMADATVYDGALVWGEVAPVPLGIYYLETAYLAVPDGYQLWHILPLGETDGGGSESGWFIAPSVRNPHGHLVVVYTPIDAPVDGQSAEGGQYSEPEIPTDSDGDGAEDDIEIAYGSDPYDAASHPAPTSTEAESYPPVDDELAAVTGLPNTGAEPERQGIAPAVALIIILAVGTALTGLVLTRRTA